MHDGIEMERRGVPSAVLCTEPFRPTVEMVAKVRGMEGYPVAYTAHPVGNLSEEEVRARARALAPEVKRLLTE